MKFWVRHSASVRCPDKTLSFSPVAEGDCERTRLFGYFCKSTKITAIILLGDNEVVYHRIWHQTTTRSI